MIRKSGNRFSAKIMLKRRLTRSRSLRPVFLAGQTTGRSERAVSILAGELRTLRPANFADGNERQHRKDGKPDHHRVNPCISWLDCRDAVAAFRAQKLSKRHEV
jgi:hypothetical protein